MNSEMMSSYREGNKWKNIFYQNKWKNNYHFSEIEHVVNYSKTEEVEKYHFSEMKGCRDASLVQLLFTYSSIYRLINKWKNNYHF